MEPRKLVYAELSTYMLYVLTARPTPNSSFFTSILRLRQRGTCCSCCHNGSVVVPVVVVDIFGHAFSFICTSRLQPTTRRLPAVFTPHTACSPRCHKASTPGGPAIPGNCRVRSARLQHQSDAPNSCKWLSNKS